MTEPSPTVSIFIPAFNAEKYIEAVICRIPEKLWNTIHRVWIIDDGSRDQTSKIVAHLAEKNEKIKCHRFSENRGYGAAVKQGLALCQNTACDVAVCLHGDGQYPPESIAAFRELMVNDGYDILQGSRIASGTALAGGMPFYKYAANRALTFLENRVFGLNLTDYHSGFLFYSRRALEMIPFEKLSNSFDFDVEVIACAKTMGLKIGEQPIPTRYAGEKSYLNPATYGLRVLGVMVKYLLGRYRKRCQRCPEKKGSSE